MRSRSNGAALIAAASLALLAASCAGTAVDMTPTLNTKVDAHVGKSWTSDSTRMVDIADEFKPNDTVFALVDVPGKIEGVVRVRWVFGESEVVQEQTIEVQEGTNVYPFRLTPPAGGLKAGPYKFEVYINENKSDSESFSVSTD